MGAAASILAVGVVILIVGAVIYYMTYSGKLTINKSKSSPNNRPPNRNGGRAGNDRNGRSSPRIQPVNGNGSVPPVNGGNGPRIMPVNGTNGPTIQPVNGTNGSIPINGNGSRSIPINGNGSRSIPINGNGLGVRTVNGNGPRVQSVNGRTSPRIQPVNSTNGPTIQSVNGRTSPRIQSNGNGLTIRRNGPEFFVQMPSNGSSPDISNSYPVNRGVRIEPVENGVNIVPVNEVDTRSTVYRCEEVSIVE